MKKPIIGAKKKASAAAEAKFGNLPKSKGLAMQPSPSNRMEIESIKSKGLTVSSAKDNVKRQVTRPYLYSMTEGRSRIHPSDTEVFTKNATQAIKAREKKLPAIEVDRKKQQIMEEYKKNKAAGAKKATKK